MKKYYWMAKADETTEKRLKTIIKLLGDGIRTVRNIAYKLYPKLHGKALDRKYNTTIKDLVKLRTSGRIKFEQIKEVRTHLSNPEGYKDIQDFIDRYEIENNLYLYYSKTKRPSHIEPIEVWYEKETVTEDVEGVCMVYDVPSLTIRGKPQWSTIKKASDRLTKDHKILYFGDNDKIGRQIFETVKDYVHYLGCECSFLWCGVTGEQEQKYGLPENARLDGLDDVDLHEIIKEAVLKYIDSDKLKQIREQQDKEKEELKDYKLKILKK